MNDQMLDGFNARAQDVIVLAEKEARILGHNYIGTEHILLGLIRKGDGIAILALQSLGISLEAVRQQIEGIIGPGQHPPHGPIPFTPRATRVLDLSRREARQRKDNYIGTEHILLGLIGEGNGAAAQVLVKLGANLNRVRQQVTELREGKMNAWGGCPPPVSPVYPLPVQPASLVLDRCGQNLTRQAKQGRLYPVIGREPEIEQVIQVLAGTARNNPVLVGGTAAGRACVMAGLAQRIAAGEVPEIIKDKQLYVLDQDALAAVSQAGNVRDAELRNRIRELVTPFGLDAYLDAYEETISNGRFGQEPALGAQRPATAAAWWDAERQGSGTARTPHRKLSDLHVLAAVLQESRTRDNIILFIDELPEVADAAAVDTSILTSVLGGKSQIIAAATAERYRESIAKDQALSPWIQPVHVSEPTISYAIGMLKIALRATAQARIPSHHYLAHHG